MQEHARNGPGVTDDNDCVAVRGGGVVVVDDDSDDDDGCLFFFCKRREFWQLPTSVDSNSEDAVAAAATAAPADDKDADGSGADGVEMEADNGAFDLTVNFMPCARFKSCSSTTLEQCHAKKHDFGHKKWTTVLNIPQRTSATVRTEAPRAACGLCRFESETRWVEWREPTGVSCMIEVLMAAVLLMTRMMVEEMKTLTIVDIFIRETTLKHTHNTMGSPALPLAAVAAG